MRNRREYKARWRARNRERIRQQDRVWAEARRAREPQSETPLSIDECRQPTSARPGTKAKIHILQSRAFHKLPLFIPGDAIIEPTPCDTELSQEEVLQLREEISHQHEYTKQAVPRSMRGGER